MNRNIEENLTKQRSKRFCKDKAKKIKFRGKSAHLKMYVVQEKKNLNYFIVSTRVDKFSTCSIQIMRKITFSSNS